MIKSILIAAGSLGVAACAGVALLVPAAAGATTVAGAGSTNGTGSITIQLTAPIQRTKTLPAAVTCTTGAHSYQVSATSRVVEGHKATVRLGVPGYTGPGTYPAVASVTITGDGTSRTIALPRSIKTTVTSIGGSVGLDTTTKNDRHIAGTATWTC